MFPVQKGRVPDPLDPWGPLRNHGVEILEGEPVAFGKLLHGDPGSSINSGFFAVTQGRFRMQYPYDEHAVVVEGECVLLDEATGLSTHYQVGDAWFVKKGTQVQWTIVSPRFAKHYMSVR